MLYVLHVYDARCQRAIDDNYSCWLLCRRTDTRLVLLFMRQGSNTLLWKPR